MSIINVKISYYTRAGNPKLIHLLLATPDCSVLLYLMVLHNADPYWDDRNETDNSTLHVQPG